jgi:murein DD-endopeptidase MepM/ murein hydrolase activator NlpD
MAGEPLHFVRADSGSWRAIGAVPVDAAKGVSARALVTLASGRVDTVLARVEVPPVPPPKAEPLTVDTVFTALDSAQVARVGRENARARAIGRRSHDTPRLWADAFLRPRASALTSTFGTGRSFNSVVTSRHLGVDFRGAVGDTVHAANRGVVVLVDTFLLAGTVLYVDHGAGVVTGYFHLSKTLVGVGDTVSGGQTIGLVGASGRVTGSHLHWSARYGALTVNPLDLVALDARWLKPH